MQMQVGQHRSQRVTADIVEIHINAIGTGALEQVTQVALFVVHAFSKAQLIHCIGTLGVGTGNAHDTRSHQSCYLTHCATNGTGGRRDHHGLTGLGLAEIHEACVAG